MAVATEQETEEIVFSVDFVFCVCFAQQLVHNCLKCRLDGEIRMPKIKTNTKKLTIQRIHTKKNRESSKSLANTLTQTKRHYNSVFFLSQ